MTKRLVSVTEILDPGPLTPYQSFVGILCFCCTLLDGFNLTVTGVAAPKIAEALRVTPTAIGLAMSAGQLGPLVGAAILGMVADRFGRKRTLVSCVFGFGLFSTIAASSTSVSQLALFIFLAGVGLGGTIPSAIAFATEYSPLRIRGTLSSMIYAGAPIGAAVSGISAIWLLPHYGWQSLYIIGGLLPMMIAVMIGLFLPESLTFLVRNNKGAERIRAIVARIAPTFAEDGAVQFYAPGVKRTGVPIRHLFREGRTTTTLLLWVSFFLGYYLMYLMLLWAPMLLKNSGASIGKYSLAFACINVGSALGTITVGRLMDRVSNRHRVLQGGCILAFLSLLAFGLFSGSPFVVVAALSVTCGLFINGTVSGLVTLVALSYPTDITGSAVGWAYAVGRSGATIAPLLGGLFVALNMSVQGICTGNAFGALVVMGLIAILEVHTKRSRQREPEAAFHNQ
jgi:MFS transporter, AAHS family, 4-hydroxybenzoate transporter